MDSSSGISISSNSSGQQNSGSEPDLLRVMDQRKRKRMISNRESARRSRLRKQNHLDGLMAQVAELRKENQQILTGLNATTRNCMSVESDNAILRAQMAELSHRLESLDEIVGFVAHVEPAAYGLDDIAAYQFSEHNQTITNGSYWNCSSQPIMMGASASADYGFLF